MSGLSVQANHFHYDVPGMRDDWNTLVVGGQERSLKTERDVEMLMAELHGNRVDGATLGDYSLDGHKVTVGKVTYDLEKATDAARFANDLRDGVLDGRGHSTNVVLDQPSSGSASFTVDGQKYGLGSANDVRNLVNNFGGADARWVGDKTIKAGGQTYDLKNKEGMQALAADLADGVIDGKGVAVAVDPAMQTATAATVAAGPAFDANGYPTVSPDDPEAYAKAWTKWVNEHTYEEFKRALDKGVITGQRELFKDPVFGMAVREKGDESSRFWEMLSFMQRNKQQIFEHLSRGWA